LVDGAARRRVAGEGQRDQAADRKALIACCVDGDPSRDPGALRNLRAVVKDGAMLDPEAMWRELGIRPLPAP
ncbi:MAG: hypothetical protein ACREST_09225, partial [Steroidobacteraceae bacterium]